MSPLCLTCKHDITLYGDQTFFIEDCWCGGYIISRNLINSILEEKKQLEEIIKILNAFYLSKEEYISKKLLKDLQLKVYLIRDKHIKRPEKFMIEVVKEVLKCA